MKTAELADEFDHIMKYLTEWEEDRNDAKVREARRRLDQMRPLKYCIDLSTPQKEVLATMLMWLSNAVERAENWSP